MNSAHYIHTADIENLNIVFSFYNTKNSQSSPWIDSFHFHSAFELQYILSGGSRIITPFSSQELDTDSICVIPPKIEHCIPASVGYATEKFAIRITFGKTNKKSEFDFYSNITSTLGKLTSPVIIDSDELRFYIKKLIGLISDTSEISKAQISPLLTIILILMFKNIQNSISINNMQKSSVSNKNDIYASKIENYIAQNYGKKLSLKSLSEHLSLSSRQCERTILQHFDMDFRSLLTKQRMTIAHQLITENKYSLEEISEKCGYSSYVGFYKAFKKYYSTSPNKYLRKSDKQGEPATKYS